LENSTTQAKEPQKGKEPENQTKKKRGRNQRKRVVRRKVSQKKKDSGWGSTLFRETQLGKKRPGGGEELGPE